MTWSCKSCTLVNHDASRSCEACGNEKPAKYSFPSTLAIAKAIDSRLSAISNAVADIFTPPVQAPKPQLPTYTIDGLSSSSSMPVLPLPHPPPPRNTYYSSSVSVLPHPSIESPPKSSLIQKNLDESQTEFSFSVEDREKNDERKAATVFAEIIQTCKALRTSFIDPDFPHAPSSIGTIGQIGDVVNGKLNENLTWLRPQEIFTKDGQRWIWAVFRDPRSSDIEQGVLGDCWLLSAMALVAERPDILEQIVLTKEYNAIGVYQIRICLDGEWKIVTVDDFFPCKIRSRALAFAIGRKNQLWVPLIEKALAKQLGSYEKLRAGRTFEGLSMLTGAACEMISLEDEEVDKDIIWARLLSAREAGYIMGCSCGAGIIPVNEAEFKAKGLLSRHAYSILDVRQVGVHKLLRLRNPWGSFVWNGDWSDRWTGWTKEMKNVLLDQVERETGAFWISYEDFQSHFNAVDVARVRSGRTHAEMRIPMQMGGVYEQKDRCLRIIVEQPTELCFTLHQSGARSLDDRVDILVCVHSVTPSGTVGDLQTRSVRKNDNFVSTGEIFLKPGQYVVISHSLGSIGYKQEKVKGTLVVHSNRPIYGDQLACPPAMYTDSLVEMVLKDGKTQSSIEGCILRYLSKNFGGLILIVDNYHEKMYMQVKAECDGSSNVLSSRGSLDIVDSIPPLHRQIILILSHFEPSQSYCVQHRMVVRTNRRGELGDWASGTNTLHFPIFQNWHSAQLHDVKPLFTL